MALPFWEMSAHCWWWWVARTCNISLNTECLFGLFFRTYSLYVCAPTYPPCWNAKIASGFSQNANVMYQPCQKWNWCAHCLPQWAAISLPNQVRSVVLFCTLISYHNRVSFRVSGSRLPNWLMCNLQFHDLSLNIVQNKTLHVDMSGKMGHSTWSCLGILCWDPPNVYLCCVWSQIKKCHRKNLFWTRYLVCQSPVWSSFNCLFWHNWTWTSLCISANSGNWTKTYVDWLLVFIGKNATGWQPVQIKTGPQLVAISFNHCNAVQSS